MFARGNALLLLLALWRDRTERPAPAARD